MGKFSNRRFFQFELPVHVGKLRNSPRSVLQPRRSVPVPAKVGDEVGYVGAHGIHLVILDGRLICPSLRAPAILSTE